MKSDHSHTHIHIQWYICRSQGPTMEIFVTFIAMARCVFKGGERGAREYALSNFSQFCPAFTERKREEGREEGSFTCTSESWSNFIWAMDRQ